MRVNTDSDPFAGKAAAADAMADEHTVIGQRNGAPRSRSERDRWKSRALPYKAFQDIALNVHKPWIIKFVMARRETSSWIGGPGKGKSAILTDLSFAIATGQCWRGYKLKEQCAVVILAFERADLLERRLEAYKRRDGVQDIPIAIVRAPVDLMAPDSVAILADTIDSVSQRFDLPVGLLVLDTFAKAIAFGGGDENSAKDQNRVLGHLRVVQNATEVHVALVGHTGKDEAKGARGSNAHLGDVDLMVQFSGDLVKSAVITKANDQPEGPLTSFKLEAYDFGVDEDGDPITTSIVSAEVPDKEPRGPQKRALSDRQKISLDALTEALISFGHAAPMAFQLPPGVKVVDASKWRDELFTRGILDREAPNPRKEFFRLRDALVARAIVGLRDDLVWKV